jgi:virginiamycin A acetyltransferase
MPADDRDEELLGRVVPALLDGLPRPWLASSRRRVVSAMPRAMASRFVRLLARVEGGTGASRTLRTHLLEREAVVLGAWSHGPGVRPGVLPPNTVIGRYCSMGPGVMVANENHPLDRCSTSGWFYDPACGLVDRRMLPARPVTAIGHDVWIGANACILPRVRSIGHGAVIGAGAVVTRDVPPLAIVGGNPARILRYRFEGERARAWLGSRWWRMNPRQLLDAFAADRWLPHPPESSSSLEESERSFEALLATTAVPTSEG